jgi:hypothetical protein
MLHFTIISHVLLGCHLLHTQQELSFLPSSLTSHLQNSEALSRGTVLPASPTNHKANIGPIR